MKRPFHFWKAAPSLTVVPKDHHAPQSSNPKGQAATLRLVKSQSIGPNGGTGNGNQDAAPPASLPRPTIRPVRSSISHDLLTYLGHSESCATLTRHGMVSSCDCRMKGFGDPAATVGLVIHFARMSLANRCAIPPVLIELLAQQVEAGDAACIMVAEWLDAMGLAEVKPLAGRTRRVR
jgi:hypothetical protein